MTQEPAPGAGAPPVMSDPPGPRIPGEHRWDHGTTEGAMKWAPPLPPELPGTVRVGSMTFAIIVDTQWCNAAEVEGRTFGDNREIYLRDDRPLEQRQQVMLHELLHVCVYGSGAWSLGGLVPGDDLEEQIVRAIATLLAGTLRDNFELTAWLMYREDG